MDVAMLVAMVVLIGLFAWFILTQRPRSVSTRTHEGQLKEQLLAFKEVGEAIQKLTQQQEEAQRLGQSLKDLLQAPKLRGTYGEVILEELLDRVLPRGIWEKQYSVNGGERVDCVVKYRDVVVPIDAKFPRDDYMRYMDAESQEERATHWKAFEEAVRKQIAGIQAKYIRPERGTSEFALMFIPSEAIYYETIAEKNHLGNPSRIQEYAQEHHVLPVSPNTFYAFLQIVVLSIRNVEIIGSAKKLQEGLAELQKSFEFFYNKYEEIGRRVAQTSEAYRVGNDHVERYKRRLDTTLQLEGLQEQSLQRMAESEERE
ncbi:MAG: DNA recombination protein RmuC [Dehalococcoidia bacterium]|jgi:DNA recombination protein RmuC|nr:DNA recombination protein RmuC [Dehalococcoidia bacterium]